MESQLNKVLADRVRRLRKERGWTQEQLAEYSGLSWGAIQSVEAGTKWPRPTNLEAIAKAFGVDPLTLFIEQPDLPPREWTDAELLEALTERFGFRFSGLEKAPPKKKKAD